MAPQPMVQRGDRDSRKSKSQNTPIGPKARESPECNETQRNESKTNGSGKNPGFSEMQAPEHPNNPGGPGRGRRARKHTEMTPKPMVQRGVRDSRKSTPINPEDPGEPGKQGNTTLLQNQWFRKGSGILGNPSPRTPQ